MVLNFQIDLIDMRHRPDGSFKWIGHYMDQWAKFLVLFLLVLVQKSAAEVAVALKPEIIKGIGSASRALYLCAGHPR